MFTICVRGETSCTKSSLVTHRGLTEYHIKELLAKDSNGSVHVTTPSGTLLIFEKGVLSLA